MSELVSLIALQKKEIAELKKENKRIKTHYEQQLKTVFNFHNKLLEENKKQGAELMKYRKALREIKNLLKNKSWSCGKENHILCDLQTDCAEFCKLQILNICEEVE